MQILSTFTKKNPVAIIYPILPTHYSSYCSSLCKEHKFILTKHDKKLRQIKRSLWLYRLFATPSHMEIIDLAQAWTDICLCISASKMFSSCYFVVLCILYSKSVFSMWQSTCFCIYPLYLQVFITSLIKSSQKQPEQTK